jgi:hypothetical protein
MPADRNARKLFAIAALVTSPHIGLWNEVSSARSSTSHSGNASLWSIHSNKDEVDLIPAGFGPVDQIKVTLPGQRGFDRKTYSGREIGIDSV